MVMKKWFWYWTNSLVLSKTDLWPIIALLLHILYPTTVLQFHPIDNLKLAKILNSA